MDLCVFVNIHISMYACMYLFNAHTHTRTYTLLHIQIYMNTRNICIYVHTHLAGAWF